MTREAYSTPAFTHRIDLHLNANESCCAIPDLAAHLEQLDSELVTRYPSHQALQESIGQWVGVDSARIVVTAGGDESIDRVMRVNVRPDRNVVVTHAPSFEMVRIYTRNYGGQLQNVPWLLGEFPTDELIDQIGERTAVVVITTPNNPTGRVVDLKTIRRVHQAARKQGALTLVDCAYVEFAEQDLTADLRDEPDLLMVRTFSKAWGLAGLRVGYLIAPTAETATSIRNAAGPFPVSAVSLETARVALASHAEAMRGNCQRIVAIRQQLADLLKACGGRPVPSGGNYLLVELDDAEAVWDGLAARGIGVRKFAGNPALENFLRITCPASWGDYLRLVAALGEISGCDVAPFRDAVSARLEVEAQPTGDPMAVAAPASEDRIFEINRQTKETNIQLRVNLDGSGQVEVSTGIGFLDHMLTALAFHAGMDLQLSCQGDLEVDDHHTAEDCAIALGTAIDGALQRRTGIRRFGYAYAPLDEAVARTVIDLSGRPWPEIHLKLEREMIGQWACENITHFFQSLAMTLKCSLHVDVLRGSNDHHKAEAAFKSLAKALQQALTRTGGAVPSTKGVL